MTELLRTGPEGWNWRHSEREGGGEMIANSLHTNILDLCNEVRQGIFNQFLENVTLNDVISLKMNIFQEVMPYMGYIHRRLYL